MIFRLLLIIFWYRVKFCQLTKEIMKDYQDLCYNEFAQNIKRESRGALMENIVAHFLEKTGNFLRYNLC